MPSLIDLRSDTVTRPSDEMREAMRDATVGNAAWGEDPTVRALEDESAAAMGHERGLFVPSGTMGNQAALAAWTAREPYAEVILEARCHILVYESAGIARIARAQARAIPGDRGVMPLDELEGAIVGPGAEALKPRTALVCIENTHNLAGGLALPLDHLDDLRQLADEHAIPVHLDGARVFNAAVAQDVAPSRIGKCADSVMFCFSKALGAPIGSVVCGSETFIEDAERARLLLGGAMRQAGIIAAAARIALDQGPKRLAEDHRRARRLAEGLAKLEGVHVDLATVETNIVYFDITGTGLDGRVFEERLLGEGVALDCADAPRVRAVTHLDVDDAGIERTLEAIGRLVEG